MWALNGPVKLTYKINYRSDYLEIVNYNEIQNVTES